MIFCIVALPIRSTTDDVANECLVNARVGAIRNYSLVIKVGRLRSIVHVNFIVVHKQCFC